MTSLDTIREMLDEYQGPMREEPLAIELYNTIYVGDGVVVDGLAEPISAATCSRPCASGSRWAVWAASRTKTS